MPKESFQIPKLIDFLEKNVVGKTVYSEEMLYDLDFGRLEGAYSTEITFSNLSWSETGYKIGGFIVSHEKLIGTGNPRAVVKDFNMISYFEYDLSKRSSSGEITGLLRYVSSSLAAVPSPAEATASSIHSITFKDNVIRWTEEQILYRDQQERDGSFSPKAFVSRHYAKIVNGKLEYGFTVEGYSVNPKTLERKRAFEYYSPFVAREK